MLLSTNIITHKKSVRLLSSMAYSNWKSTNAITPMLSCEVSKLRTASEILNTGIFVETNRSFNDIVRSIKYLMEEYNIDLDYFIFYVS